MKQLFICALCTLSIAMTSFAQNHLHIVNSNGGELAKLESIAGFPHMVLSNDHGNIFKIGLAETANDMAPDDDDLFIQGLKPFSRIRMEVGDGTGKGVFVINPTNNINSTFKGAYVGINANSPSAPLTVSSINGGVTAEFRSQGTTTFVEWTAQIGGVGSVKQKGIAGFIDEANNAFSQDNFRIGTSNLNPNGALDLRTQGINRMTVKNTGEVFIGDFTNFVGVAPELLNICGNVQAAGNFIGNAFACSSDFRFKKDIMKLDNSLQDIMQLNGVSYNWKTEEFAKRGFTEEKQIGLIAQEVEAVIPELVQTGKDGYKSVDYQSLSAVLIEAIKEQQHTIESLEKTIESLGERLTVLEN